MIGGFGQEWAGEDTAYLSMYMSYYEPVCVMRILFISRAENELINCHKQFDNK